MVLESGFDKELIGSNPEKLSLDYLQDLYESTRTKEEQALCYGCKKIFDNAKNKDSLVNLFPFVNEFSHIKDLEENIVA